MAARNPSDPEDFERQWEALTESLGELEVPPPDVAEPQDVPTPGSPPDADGWGGADVGSPARGPRDYQVAEEDEGHFVPPDPVIKPDGDPWRRAGWAAAAVGAVGAFVCLLARSVIPTVWIQVSCAVLLVGIAVVFVRLPSRRERDGDDSGAQV